MKKYGIALGGGAAKSYAHIGVLQYLQEKNITITEIAGTSIGSLVGALFDMDWDFLCLKGEKMKEILQKYLWNITFEKLQIPLKVVAVNLETGERKIFQSGSVVDAIRAKLHSRFWV